MGYNARDDEIRDKRRADATRVGSAKRRAGDRLPLLSGNHGQVSLERTWQEAR